MNWVILWLAVIIIAAVVEFLSVQLIAVWFCIGGLFAMAAAYFKVDILWQIIIFLIVSLIFILSTRKFAKKLLAPRIQRTNADRLIGMDCVIVEPIHNIEGRGTARVQGVLWTARAVSDDMKFSVDEIAVIREISGVKLIVDKKVRQDEKLEGDV